MKREGVAYGTNADSSHSYVLRTDIEEGEEVIITLRDAMVKLFEGKEVPIDVIIEPTTEHFDTSLEAFLDR